MSWYTGPGGKLLIAALLLFHGASAKVYPAEAASFYSRRVPLQVDDMSNVGSYVFKTAKGIVNDEYDLNKALISKQSSVDNKVIVDLPWFDEQYSWQVEYLDKKGKKIAKSPIYHFRTLNLRQNNSDTSKYRIRVLENKYSKDSLLFFLDCPKAIYDLNGDKVWCLGNTLPDLGVDDIVSDLKTTSDHTITFIAGVNAYEVNYTGTTLFVTPDLKKEGLSRYHHEFTKLKNGNYMILSSEMMEKEIPGKYLSEEQKKHMDGASKIPVEFDNILELDKEGRTIWKWKSAEYFTDDFMFSRKTTKGEITPRTVTGHMNSFYFDEQERVVYANYKDMSRIVKIGYPDKKVLAEYDGKIAGEKTLFSKQHDVTVDEKGNIILFSNNNGNYLNNRRIDDFSDDRLQDSVSTVVILKQTNKKPGQPEKAWEFDCTIDADAPSFSYRGGSVTKLKDGNLFVCMGGSPRIFIVDKNRQVLFNAIVEEWNNGENRWLPSPQYKASPIYKKELDELIYGSITP